MWAQDNSQQGPPSERHDRAAIKMLIGPGMSTMRIPPGTWWRDSETVQKLNLTDAQAQQIEKAFQDTRQALELAGRNLHQQELALDPLINTEPLDEARISAQLDAIAQARLNLEKVNSSMLMAVRKALTLDQWKTLQSLAPRKDVFFIGHERHELPPPPPPEF
jgi:Spy/CpxP family protein refolding chaperone